MRAPYLELVESEERCNVDHHSFPKVDNSGKIIAIDYVDVNKSNIDVLCPNISLTEEDKNIIFDFVDELKPNRGYTNIEKQSDDEYSNFLNEMNKINSEICNCQKIILHGRNDSWTAYTNGFKETCSFSPACYQPPAFCFSSNNNYIKPDLIFIAILGIPIIIILIFLIKKRKVK